MTFFPEPLRPSEGPDEDRLRVNPIEADRRYKETPYNEAVEEKAKSIPAYTCLLFFFKELSNYFNNERPAQSQPIDSPELMRDLLKLSALLEKLKEGDFSKDAHYCQVLSELWHQILSDIDMEIHLRPSHPKNLGAVKDLITEMGNFPPNTEHRLGFYLEHYAGENWLPVPFSEILKQLHQDHKTYGDKSTLASWSEKIKGMIQE